MAVRWFFGSLYMLMPEALGSERSTPLNLALEVVTDQRVLMLKGEASISERSKPENMTFDDVLA